MELLQLLFVGLIEMRQNDSNRILFKDFTIFCSCNTSDSDAEIEYVSK